MTELEKLIRAAIEADGPMPLDRYMSLCLGHPQHGYYMKQDPFGAGGDFTTAPEVSQVFGELIGVWIANLNLPEDAVLVELGPGRGTLMADMLRVLRKFGFERPVHLVETSLVLREVQKATVFADVKWHDSIATLPEKHAVIIANEFFDALPIRQFELRQGRVFERVVGLEDDKISLGLVPSAEKIIGEQGDIIEVSTTRSEVATQLAAHIATFGGAALVIDYGHKRSAAGDTLQALHRHKYCSILEQMGDADLTSHVDFEALGKAVMAGGAEASRVFTQRAFLIAMGIEARMAHLQKTADENVLLGAERLIDPQQMGDLFKVMAITQTGASPYPFGTS